ncbi:MAG: hypothetical protein HY319_12900 [Armatimonadetes bacterium]|nr:hypothetical protein [Armatimonadota bacterium]
MTEVQVDLARGLFRVRGPAPVDLIRQTVEQLGYGVSIEPPDNEFEADADW